MKAALYLETTIVSYCMARPTDKLIVDAPQELTRQWWEQRLKNFRAFISQFVLDEVGDGDPIKVRRRLQALRGIERLPTVSSALERDGKFFCPDFFHARPRVMSPIRAGQRPMHPD